MTTVICLSGDSVNDALRAAGKAHRALFEALGHDYVEIDLAEAGSQELLLRTVREQSVEFVYGAMGNGADFRANGPDGIERNLWEVLSIPYIALMGDSPAYYFPRHVMPTPWHACLYCFPEHLELRKRLGREPALYGILPPIPLEVSERREIDFAAKAEGTLFFLKNGNDPEQLLASWRNAMPSGSFILLSELAGELVRCLGEDIGCDIDRMVTESFLDRGWDIAEFINLRLFFVAQLDDYLRRVKSNLIANAIADFPVHIQGYNWEHLDLTGRRASYTKGGDYRRSREQIIAALGLIDMSPNTQRAPHDRVMRAFGSYTLCLTNQQEYFDANFENASEFTYRYEADSLREKVADALAHPKRYVELGIHVAEQFRSKRHPHDLARFMVDTASHVRLTCGPRPDGLQYYFAWPIPWPGLR